ncbi:DUF2326 domain-containing protein, partial [Peptoniphilus genitalis]
MGSFRELISRYFRIYGKDNHNEKEPLKAHINETKKNAIKSLEKLYDSFKIIQEYQEAVNSLKEKIKTANDARKQNIISYGSISNKTQYKENMKKLKSLDTDLQNLTE